MCFFFAGLSSIYSPGYCCAQLLGRKQRDVVRHLFRWEQIILNQYGRPKNLCVLTIFNR